MILLAKAKPYGLGRLIVGTPQLARARAHVGEIARTGRRVRVRGSVQTFKLANFELSYLNSQTFKLCN
jgi:hypothetical protein